MYSTHGSTHNKTNRQMLTGDYPCFSSSMKVHDLAPTNLMAGAFVFSIVILCVQWKTGSTDKQSETSSGYRRAQTGH